MIKKTNFKLGISNGTVMMINTPSIYDKLYLNTTKTGNVINLNNLTINNYDRTLNLEMGNILYLTSPNTNTTQKWNLIKNGNSYYIYTIYNNGKLYIPYTASNTSITPVSTIANSPNSSFELV